MTGERFVLEVKAKLNRLDSAAYEDVRDEEIYFFGYDALKHITLEFALENYRGFQGEETIKTYLASLVESSGEITLVNNKVSLPDLFNIRDMDVYVKLGAGDTLEEGWQPTRDLSATGHTDSEYNMFTRSYPDRPSYRLINNNIEFTAEGFECTKIEYDYLKYPEVITDSSNLDMTWIMELQDKTVTLILENLESRRIQTQPVVSRS